MEISNYKVVLLCGGQGTRIRGVNDGLPKPLIEVGGRPILWHIMKIYSYYGLRKFVLCLGHKGETIIDYFNNYRSRNHDFTMKIKEDIRSYLTENVSDVDDWEITFAQTGENSMTGGRIKRIEKYINEEIFFCTYGDGVSDVDIPGLYNFHVKHGKIATLTGVHLPTTFGIVETDKSAIVTSFREKPVMSGLINGGFFVFNKEIFEYIEGDSTVLEDMPFKRLVKNRQIAMHKHEGFWHCMDTYKDYDSLNRLWNGNKAPWKIW